MTHIRQTVKLKSTGELGINEGPIWLAGWLEERKVLWRIAICDKNWQPTGAVVAVRRADIELFEAKESVETNKFIENPYSLAESVLVKKIILPPVDILNLLLNCRNFLTNVYQGAIDIYKKIALAKQISG